MSEGLRGAASRRAATADCGAVRSFADALPSFCVFALENRCGHCKALAPNFAKAATALKGVAKVRHHPAGEKSPSRGESGVSDCAGWLNRSFFVFFDVCYSSLPLTAPPRRICARATAFRASRPSRFVDTTHTAPAHPETIASDGRRTPSEGCNRFVELDHAKLSESLTALFLLLSLSFHSVQVFRASGDIEKPAEYQGGRSDKDIIKVGSLTQRCLRC